MHGGELRHPGHRSLQLGKLGALGFSTASLSRKGLEPLRQRPQATIDALLLDKEGMRPPLDKLSLRHDVHLVGPNQIGQTVRYHQNGLVEGHLLNGLGHEALAFGVDVGGHLIENVDRRVAQKRTGEAQALALPAGKVKAPRQNRGVQTAHAKHEIVKMGLVECPPKLAVGGIGLGKRQIGTDAPFENMAFATDDAHHAAQISLVKVAQLGAVDGDAAPVTRDLPRQKLGNRRLARPRRARQTDEGVRGHLQIKRTKRVLLAVVGKARILEHDTRLGSQTRAVPCVPRLKVQKIAHIVDGLARVHAHVEGRAELAHRQKEARCHQQDEERAAGIDHTEGKLHQNDHVRQGDGPVGAQIHEHHVAKLHAQQLHGERSEVFRLGVKLLLLSRIGIEHLERDHALKRVFERRRQVHIAAPLATRQTLRPAHEHHDAHRHGGHANKQQQRRRRVDRAKNQREQAGGDQGEEQLRHVAGNIGNDARYPLAHHETKLIGCQLLLVARAQLHKLEEHLLEQGTPHRASRPIQKPARRASARQANQNKEHENKGESRHIDLARHRGRKR